MKSEHRHQLKTNELAEWLGNLPQWTKDNLLTVLAASAVIVAAATYYIWNSYNKGALIEEQNKFMELLDQLRESKMRMLQAQSQGRDTSYILVQPAENLKIFAQNTNSEQMAALALTKYAEALRTELHNRHGTVSEQNLAEQIKLAKDAYKDAYAEVIVPVTGSGARSKANASLVAAAEFGLGLCEEELGNFEQARQKYHDIIAEPNFEGTAAVEQAKRRLETMADYTQKVVFKPKPEPIPSIAPEPELSIVPELIDANQPADINVPIDINVPADMNVPIDFDIPIPPIDTEGH